MIIKYFSHKILFFTAYLISILGSSQVTIQGKVIDKRTKEELIGANIFIKEDNIGTVTDLNGHFIINVEKLPVNIDCSYIGYKSHSILIINNENILFPLEKDKLLLNQVNITDNRLSEKLKQSPVTIESMDIIAIKEAPASSFYEGLGNLKGVDLTSASLAFKIINTRGFNSTSPVRSLQIIDGVDNQSPGLNFSLGNFLGTTELDTKGVEIIVGANSALYGPNAFNGVINMTTKDPFMFPGISHQVKIGERALLEHCFRYADNKKDNHGNQIGFKFNIQYLQANDWEADNIDQSYNTNSLSNNPGGYDAVNIYGDEYNITNSFTTKPGLGTVHRTGYSENQLADYNTQNLKVNSAFHIKNKNNYEFIYSINFGNGTTIYQGDNRYSLKNINFLQNKIEFKKDNNFFIRLYSTQEDAGDSYDIIATAESIVNRVGDNKSWNTEYGNFWNSNILELMEDDLGYISKEDWIAQGGDLISWINNTQTLFDENPELLNEYHQLAREYADNYFLFAEPGTQYFNDLFNEITSTTRYDEYGNLIEGSRFYDKSKLYHLQGEKKIEINNLLIPFGCNGIIAESGTLTIGGNIRLYRPDSRGSIFNDGFIYDNYVVTDADGAPIIDTIFTSTIDIFGNTTLETSYQEKIATDTIRNKISNYEYGFYSGLDLKLFGESLILNTTTRIDKNENFDYVFSPAFSIVFKPNERDVIRFSKSSAIRNPTLTDQYLNYNAGLATLLGNLNGFGYDEYFVNTDSLLSYLRGENALGVPNTNALRGSFIRIDPIKPEQVNTTEIGFRTTMLNKIFIDASYYYSIYTNFIGYQIGATYESLSDYTKIATQEDINEGWAEYIGQEIKDYLSVDPSTIRLYRLAANAKEKITTQGLSVGINYYINESTVLNGNYSWNKLINEETKDPLVPAYNTPENKFNIGLSKKLAFYNNNKYNVSINYKWIEGFLFEGSPQFTGFIDSYDLIDAQVNRIFNTTYSLLTAKIGVSNLLNNQIYQAYGGPRIGRLCYLALTFDFK